MRDDVSYEKDLTMTTNADSSSETSATRNTARSWWQGQRAKRTVPPALPSRPPRMIRRLILAVVSVLSGLLALVFVGVGILYYQGTRPPAGDSQYVALGSSFAAGPGVGQPAPNSPALCMRSAENYAHLLAASRGLNLTDVTCSGATAANVLSGKQFFQPPQVDALRSSTELVTVTVGGNDISYLGNLFAWSCQQDPLRVPLMWRLEVCTSTPDADVDRQLAELPALLEKIATEVRQRSPRATLVFVDYTTVLPKSGSCPDRLPITEQQLERSRSLAGQLADITAAVARNTGALLVRASEITRGHDICSADPWVYPDTFPTTPFSYGPVAYHPTEQAMQAIADAINQSIPLLSTK
ncbi:MAG: SGNH/GDSL hydrolase family protein [Anaerolineales bacterium]